MKSLIEKAKLIRLITFDVDGVLTRGGMVYTAQGISSKQFNVYDGQGMRHLLDTGVEVAIITACKSDLIRYRMEDLGVKHLYQGGFDKLNAYEDIKNKLDLRDEQIASMGDDLPDLPLIRRAGLGITVPNAAPIMKEYADWITERSGGMGAVREVCDFIMQAQGTYQTVIDSYLTR